jgi:MOSC domain-containing protein YiiM
MPSSADPHWRESDTAAERPGSVDGMVDPALPHRYDVAIELLLASPRHRYEGRPADGPVPVDVRETRERIELRAGLGIVGDRYFNARAHMHASVTIIGADALDDIAAELGATIDPARTRRNIVLRGVDVDALRGMAFSLDSGAGPVGFQGYRPANPCAWMDHELAPGAFRAMRGRGGIRCDPTTDGELALGPAVLRTAEALR